MPIVSNKEKKIKLDGLERITEASFYFGFLIAFLFFLSLISFNSSDPSFYQSLSNKQVIHNWLGTFGSYSAALLMFVFGYVAYLVPVLMVIIFWKMLNNSLKIHSEHYFLSGSKCLGLFLLISTSCGLLELSSLKLFTFHSGGIIGNEVSLCTLPFFGLLGSKVILFLLFLLSLTLFFGISWIAIIYRSYSFSRTNVMKTINYMRNTRDVTLLPFKKNELLESNHESKGESKDKENDIFNQIKIDNDNRQTIQENCRADDKSSNKKQLNNSIFNGLLKMVKENIFIKIPESDGSENVADEKQRTPFRENTHDENIDKNEAYKKFDSNEDSNNLEVNLPDNGDTDELTPKKNEFLDEIQKVKDKQSNEINPFLQKKNNQNNTLPKGEFPGVGLLSPAQVNLNTVSPSELEKIARLLESKLSEYKIKAEVVGVYPGPVITRFELELAPGVKVSRLSGLSKDIARSLSTSAVRVVEVIPGKPYVGLELPNPNRETVFLSEVIGSKRFNNQKTPLPMVLGKDIAGEPIVADLSKMPHLLVAGTTGSGKSVGVNVMILSLLYKCTPEDCRFIMIDPKMLELSVYEGIPHLLSEVVTDMKDASNALRWCVAEMERRYKLLAACGVRNVAGFNEKLKEAKEAGHPIYDPLWKEGDTMDSEAPLLEKMPNIVVIVDEFADLIMVVGKKVEELIARLAQKARAAGIHLILATQRPSVDVITGLIKANIPTRMAFTVSTKTDSRTILDQGGAESLLGMGDMLYLPPGQSHTIRVHGAFASDEDVHSVVSDWKARGKPQYIDSILNGNRGQDSLLPGESNSDSDHDELFDEVVAFVTETRKGSISGVQRKFKIGYNRAARIVEQLEAHGIVSPPGHNGNREVLANSTKGE